MKKILLFGFDALPEILTAAGIAQRFDAEAVTVSREGCGLTLAALSQGQTAGGAGLPVGGKMMVFCGLERELDDLLAALRGAGIVCLKAVLTHANQHWMLGWLCRERDLDGRAIGGP